MSSIEIHRVSSILNNFYAPSWQISEHILTFAINSKKYSLNYKRESFNLAKFLCDVIQKYEKENALKLSINYKEMTQALSFFPYYRHHKWRGNIPNLLQTETAIEDSEVDFQLFERQLNKLQKYNEYLGLVNDLLKTNPLLAKTKILCEWNTQQYEFNQFVNIYKTVHLDKICQGAFLKVLELGEQAVIDCAIDIEQQKSGESTTRYAVYLNNRFLPANSTQLNYGVPTSIATARTFKTIQEAKQAVERRGSKADRYAIIKVDIEASEVVFSNIKVEDATLSALRAKVEKKQILKTLGKGELKAKLDSMQSMIDTYKTLLEKNEIVDPFKVQSCLSQSARQKNKL